jgi:4a-hydroxytetrahydrobiopterin dehydratase
MPKKMNDAEIQKNLSGLKGWSFNGQNIFKVYEFSEYLKSLPFVDSLARESEKMDHHPNIIIGWRKVQVEISTHSVQGITELDFNLARKAEEIFSK